MGVREREQSQFEPGRPRHRAVRVDRRLRVSGGDLELAQPVVGTGEHEIYEGLMAPGDLRPLRASLGDQVSGSMVFAQVDEDLGEVTQDLRLEGMHIAVPGVRQLLLECPPGRFRPPGVKLNLSAYLHAPHVQVSVRALAGDGECRVGRVHRRVELAPEEPDLRDGQPESDVLLLRGQRVRPKFLGVT